MQMRHASRTPSPQPLCYEPKLQKNASTSNGGDQTPRQRSTSPTMRFDYLEDEQSQACLRGSVATPRAGYTCASTSIGQPKEEHMSNKFYGDHYVGLVPQEQAMNGPSSQHWTLEVQAAPTMTPSLESQMPEMLVAQLPVVASPGQALCLPSLAGKGRRWADMDDEELEIASGDALAEVPPEDAFSVSKGSTGHPFSCNAPCKYALKPRGCKDGAECDRCHLCKWKKPKNQAKVEHASPKGEECKSNARS